MMDILTGKTLLFTDIHFGLKQNSVSRLNICVKAVKQILETIKKEDVKNVIFGGDLFHERVSVNVNTMNIALKCVQAIAKRCKTYLVVGNHDTHYKNSADINSLNMFRDTANVTVVDKALEIELNGKKVLLCPWLADLQQFKKESYDMLVGHFDVQPKFLQQCYIEDNLSSARASSSVAQQIDNDSLLKTSANAVHDSVGSFIDLAKPTGIVFAGHIHKNREFIAKRRKFIFIGSPTEQTRADIGNACGWYVLDEDMKLKRILSAGLPKHLELKMSQILAAGIDKFDFSVVKGSILHKVYDCDVSQLDDAKITQKTTDYKPYEELVPEYAVAARYDDTVPNEAMQLIKKSKLEYIKSYIDSMDKKMLAEQQIDPERLYKLLEEHYEKVVDGQ